ncbi:MAG: PKD domain-containing protein [Bacteroidales bacterium]|nr:PKD domain-containing protein [Bacteroidales bacterium]
MKTIILTLVFICILNLFYVKSQTGSTCNQAHVINAIPFVQTGLATVGTTYNSLPCSGSGFSNYMSGKDYVFVFTPTQSADYTIKLTNTSPAVGLFVTNLCPDDPNVQCIANNKAPMGNPSLTVALTSGSTYYIIVSSINFTTPQTSFDIQINMCLSAPDASFTYTQNGLSVQFTNTSQNAVSYLWYFGDELVPPPFSPGDTNTHPTHTYSQYGSYVVTLIAYNACGQTDTIRDTINVECPGNLPIANFTYVANGLQVSFINQSTDATSYSWFFGDEVIPFIPSDSIANPTHTYNQYGTYNVTLVASNECGTDTIVIPITLECPGNMPVAGFTYNIQPNGTVNFTSTSTDATQWKWFFGDTDIFPFLPGDTVENPTHTYLLSGTYTVYLIVYNECGSDTISQVINVTVTSLSTSNYNDIKIYPNPLINNTLFVQGINNFNYEITDITGKVIIKGTCSNGQIDITEKISGTYIFSITTDALVSRKFLLVIY